jgi:hypothetical protein
MGNTQSKKTDHKPEQHSEKGMREYGLEFNKKYPLGGPFFIEGQNPKNGIYEFRIYHLHKSRFFTEFMTFETCHPLRNEFKVVYDGSIVKFVFETDSFEKGLKHVLEFEFEFSASFQSKKEFSGPLLSMPHLLPPDRKITILDGLFFYYIVSFVETHKIYIVKLSDKKKPHGFESTFENGDTVIDEITVESSNFPFVMNDEQGNPVIASVDEGFESIPIRLPSDKLTLTQALGQETFQ